MNIYNIVQFLTLSLLHTILFVTTLAIFIGFLSILMKTEGTEENHIISKLQKNSSILTCSILMIISGLLISNSEMVISTFITGVEASSSTPLRTTISLVFIMLFAIVLYLNNRGLFEKSPGKRRFTFDINDEVKPVKPDKKTSLETVSSGTWKMPLNQS